MERVVVAVVSPVCGLGLIALIGKHCGCRELSGHVV